MPALLSGLEPAARIVVATLFNSLWEAAVLAAVVALVLRVLPNVNATTRYAAWCVALVGSLLLPLATALPQIAVQPAVVRQTHHDASQTAPKTTTSTRRSVQAPVVQPKSNTVTTAAPSRTFRLPERLHFSLPQYVALAIFAVWCLAAVLLLVRLAVNLWKLERLKTDALPLPVEYRERLERWATADKGEREVRLCTCDAIEVPVAVGLFDSMILIPQHLLDTLSQSEIDQIILHELAHLRRADDWTNGFQRFIQALFFFNPAVLYIAQQLDLEREVACDDWVVHQTKEVRPYATCLTKMAEATAWPHRPLAAPGVFVTRRGLSVRVERLLRAGRNIRTSVSFGPTGAIVASLIVLFFVLQTVAPSFAFTMNGQSAQHAVTVAMEKTPPQKKAVKSAAPAAVVTSTVAQSTAAPAPAKSPSAKASNPHVKYIVVPPVNVDIPGQHIDIPEQHAHVRGQRIPVVVKTLPPDFAKRMAQVSNNAVNVSATVSKEMAAAFNGKGGKFNCVGCDFSGQNLSGHSFRGQQLSGADFSNTNLQNADFSNSVLVGADFSHANLRGANFANAKLSGCDFSYAQIDGVNFSGASLVGCSINAHSLRPAQAASLLRGCRTGCDFSGADLSGQDLRNLDLSGVDLSNANLRGANLSGARLQGVDFSGAHLEGAHFDGTDIIGCDLSGVDLQNVDLSKARITGSKLTPTR